MENNNEVNFYMNFDTSVAKAQLVEIKGIINKIKDILADPSALVPAFDGLDIKVGVVQEKIDILLASLESLDGVAPQVIVFQEMVTQINQVSIQVTELNQQTNQFITNINQWEQTASITAEVSSQVEDLKTTVTDLNDKVEETPGIIGEIRKVFEQDLPLIRKEIETFSTGLEEMKTGFTAANELAGMFGLKNIYISEAIDKVTKAQEAFATGKKIVEGIQTAYGKFQTAVGSVSKGLNTFKVALAGTGIGLLITAVGLLISNFDGIKEMVGKLADRFPFLKKAIDAVKKVFDAVVNVGREFLSFLGFVPDKIDDTNKEIIENEKAKNEELEKERQEHLRKEQEYEQLRIENMKDGIEKELANEQLKYEKLKEQYKDNKKAFQEIENSHQKEIENIKESWANKVKKQEDDRIKDERRKAETERKERLKNEEDYEKLHIANMKEGLEKELAEEDFKYKKEKEQYKNNKKALAEIEILHNKTVADINKEWEEKAKKDEENAAKKRLEDNKKWLDEEKKAYKDAQAEKKEAYSDTLKALKESNDAQLLVEREQVTKGELTKEQMQENARKRETELLLARKDTQNAFFIQQQADLISHYDTLLNQEKLRLDNGLTTEAEYDTLKTNLEKEKNENFTSLKDEQAQQAKETEKAITEDHIKTLEENAAREKAIRQATFEAFKQITAESFGLIDGATELFGKKGKEQTALQRKAALVKLGIDTATSLSSAIATATAPTPDNVATGGLAGIARYIALAVKITSSAAKIKSALQNEGDASGAASGAGGTGTPSITPPQVKAPQLGGRDIQVQQVKPEPIKVFVSEADIRNVQQRVNVIDGQSVVV